MDYKEYYENQVLDIEQSFYAMNTKYSEALDNQLKFLLDNYLDDLRIYAEWYKKKQKHNYYFYDSDQYSRVDGKVLVTNEYYLSSDDLDNLSGKSIRTKEAYIRSFTEALDELQLLKNNGEI